MSKIEISNELISKNSILILEDSNNYVINWDIITAKEVLFQINPNAFVSVLEYGNKGSKNVKYIINENAELKVNICSLNDAFDANYQFVLNEGSHALIAYADFDKGTKNCNIVFDLNGRHSIVNWHLASLTAFDDKKEFAVSFNHNASDTTALMDNYGVCKDNSALTFSGVGYIHKNAKHAKTHQNAKIMVFDEKCNAKASPILKIDENDVEASHAATVGKVNDEHLFYLCSRGISEEDAKRLITLGYLNPIIKYFEDEQVSGSIDEAIQRRV